VNKNTGKACTIGKKAVLSHRDFFHSIRFKVNKMQGSAEPFFYGLTPAQFPATVQSAGTSPATKQEKVSCLRIISMILRIILYKFVP